MTTSSATDSQGATRAGRGISGIVAARRRCGGPVRVAVLSVCALLVLVVLVSAASEACHAASAAAAPASSLNQVIDRLVKVIGGLLAGLATLFATVGGVRYILAGGDPGEVEAAKKTLKFAAVGYGVAVLAPLLLKILQGIVGTPS